MKDHAGRVFVFNGKMMDNVRPLESRTGKFVEIYEVVRMIEGVPLFFEDHYSRLASSANFSGFTLNVSQEELRRQISRLLKENEMTHCNVKIVVSSGDDRQDVLLYISASYYPPEEVIAQGVRVSLFHWERRNPNAKLINSGYKEAVAAAIDENNVFEVLLVNDDDKLTEGSRSNVFFVRGERIFTAPGEYVLKGVTRKYVFEACRRAGFEVEETLVGASELAQMEGLFLSGTSIKVLPVSHVDGKVFSSSAHPVITAVRKAFDRLQEEYVQGNKPVDLSEYTS